LDFDSNELLFFPKRPIMHNFASYLTYRQTLKPSLLLSLVEVDRRFIWSIWWMQKKVPSGY